MNKQEINEWAKAYAEAIQSTATSRVDDLPWAIERFMNIQESNQAEEAWAAILEVLSNKPTPEVISALAAGPIEDLIETWGETFIERVERESQSNPDFRKALRGVWRSSTPSVWERIQRAQGES